MKKKISMLIIVLFAFAAIVQAKPVIEAGLFGNYSLYGDFDPGMGISLEGRWITKDLEFTRSPYIISRLHKIGLSVHGLTANSDNLRSAPESGWDNSPSYEEEMRAVNVEIAPMFCLNDGDMVKSYLGIGLDLYLIRVEESGVYFKDDDSGGYEEFPYSIDKGSGIHPGLRLFFETQWFLSPQYAANLGAGFRFCQTRKLTNESSDDLSWRARGEDKYNLNGFHLYLGFTVIFNRPG